MIEPKTFYDYIYSKLQILTKKKRVEWVMNNIHSLNNLYLADETRKVYLCTDNKRTEITGKFKDITIENSKLIIKIDNTIKRFEILDDVILKTYNSDKCRIKFIGGTQALKKQKHSLLIQYATK